MFFDVYIFTHAHAYMRFFGMKNAVLRNQCHPPYFPGFLKASVHSKAEHVNRGEECSYQFVKQTLKQAIEHWKMWWATSGARIGRNSWSIASFQKGKQMWNLICKSSSGASLRNCSRFH